MCRHCGKPATYRICAVAKQAHEKEEKKHAKDNTSSGNQRAIARLEELLKAAKNKNKRLAAKAQTGKTKDAAAEPEYGCDEEEPTGGPPCQVLPRLDTHCGLACEA